MKISSEELGRLLVAFGETLIHGGLNSMEKNTHVDRPSNITVADTDKPDVTEECEQLLEDSTEAAHKTTTGTFEAYSEMEQPVDSQHQIAELEKQLLDLKTQQNQSGLDLKPIKL